MPRVVAAPDKFRGTASAAEVAGAIGRAARRVGWHCDERPVADGGEGLLDVLGGPNRTTRVRGPLGDPVDASWRLDGTTAVIEMARASGLLLAGGAAGNDALAASTAGTGELILAAVDAGARTVIVGAGGSATTDGGLGALDVIGNRTRLRGARLVVACDVQTLFVDAAETFAPQKGASPAQTALLRHRLERLVAVYEQERGVAIAGRPGSGAAGGLAGGLAALGAELVGGFDLVAAEICLEDAVEGADAVVTGEGLLDGQSFAGKAVGGVVELARDAGARTLIVVGEVAPDALPLPAGVDVVDLVERVGRPRALDDVAGSVEEVVSDWLQAGR